MSDKAKTIWKAIGMFLAYTTIMSALVFLPHSRDSFDSSRWISWGMWLLFGIWQSYRWLYQKLANINNDDK